MSKQKITVVDDVQWLGTEASLVAYLGILQKDEERLQAGAQASVYSSRDRERDLPYLFTKSGNVGIVAIKGPTTNRTSYWDEVDQRATYPAIREALMEAATDSEVSHILLDIDSPGGAVSGIADVSNLIRTINDKVKPVTAFTDGNMMSAAYWMGSSAGKVYASKVAGVGSIGVIATHMEMSKMMEEAGIKVTVMRAGKYKALANSAEPLTDAARDQMQAGLDATYSVFVQHVADMRGVSYNKADSTMAQGREFYGDAALSAGLVDGIESFDSVMSKLSVDKRQGSSQNSQNILTGNAMSKQALTETQIALLAAGATAVTAGEPEVGDQSLDAQATGEGGEATEANTQPTAQAAEEGQEASAQAAPSVVSPATPANPAPEAALVQFLQAQVKEKDGLLLQQALDLKAATTKVADLEAATSGLIEIAIKSTNNMRIAMGGSMMDMSGLSATAILADHAAVSQQFSKKFVAGGLAAVDAAQAKKEGQSVAKPNGYQAALLKAASTKSR